MQTMLGRKANIESYASAAYVRELRGVPRGTVEAMLLGRCGRRPGARVGFGRRLDRRTAPARRPSIGAAAGGVALAAMMPARTADAQESNRCDR